jgi:hypothetical protein
MSCLTTMMFFLRARKIQDGRKGFSLGGGGKDGRESKRREIWKGTNR